MGWIKYDPKWYANFLYYYVIICSIFKFKIFLSWVITVLLILTALSIVFLRYPWPNNNANFTYGAYVWTICMIYAAILIGFKRVIHFAHWDDQKLRFFAPLMQTLCVKKYETLCNIRKNRFIRSHCLCNGVCIFAVRV